MDKLPRARPDKKRLDSSILVYFNHTLLPYMVFMLNYDERIILQHIYSMN